jgi:hypothetical protein
MWPQSTSRPNILGKERQSLLDYNTGQVKQKYSITVYFNCNASLTSRGGIILEKPIVAQVVKKIPLLLWNPNVYCSIHRSTGN